MMPSVKGVGFMNLFKDVKGAMKALWVISNSR